MPFCVLSPLSPLNEFIVLYSLCIISGPSNLKLIKKDKIRHLSSKELKLYTSYTQPKNRALQIIFLDKCLSDEGTVRAGDGGVPVHCLVQLHVVQRSCTHQQS